MAWVSDWSHHGGHIWMHSEPGPGTTFKIDLPAAESIPEPKMPEPAASPAIASGSETMMVVEDNDTVRQLTVDVAQPSRLCGPGGLEGWGVSAKAR